MNLFRQKKYAVTSTSLSPSEADINTTKDRIIYLRGEGRKESQHKNNQKYRNTVTSTVWFTLRYFFIYYRNMN